MHARAHGRAQRRNGAEAALPALHNALQHVTMQEGHVFELGMGNVSEVLSATASGATKQHAMLLQCSCTHAHNPQQQLAQL